MNAMGPKQHILGKGILVKLSSFVSTSPPVKSLDLFTASQAENSFESGKKYALKIIHMMLKKVLLTIFKRT